MATVSQHDTQTLAPKAGVEKSSNPNHKFAFEWFESFKKFEPETKNFWC